MGFEGTAFFIMSFSFLLDDIYNLGYLSGGKQQFIWNSTVLRRTLFLLATYQRSPS